MTKSPVKSSHSRTSDYLENMLVMAGTSLAVKAWLSTKEIPFSLCNLSAFIACGLHHVLNESIFNNKTVCNLRPLWRGFLG